MIKNSFGILIGASTVVFTYEYYKWRNNITSAEKKNDQTKHDDSFRKLGLINPTSKNDEGKKKSCHSDNDDIMNRHPNVNTHTISFDRRYRKLVPRLFKIIDQAKEETGSPGIAFAVSHNGSMIMKGGIGMADVENGVLCTSETVMRIASISKSLTSIAIGKLIEEGSLDIDEPIQKYIKDFDEKTYDGEPVKITTRQLLSHTSGIRGYFGDPKKYDAEKANDKTKRKHDILKNITHGNHCEKEVWDENFSMKHYKTVKDGLALFEQDPLIYKPGTDFEYSSLAYSLVSRIIEVASGKDYVTYMKSITGGIGLKNTLVDLNDPIVLSRSRNYYRSKKNHKLLNSPYVDNSYKWSGGGFLSTVTDLITLGNNTLKSYSTDTGYLKQSTMAKLWKPEEVSAGKYGEYEYALGWIIQQPTNTKKFAVNHTGGAIGASSVLLVIPPNHITEDHPTTKEINEKDTTTTTTTTTEGTVIALIVNMQSVGLLKTAEKMADVIHTD